MSIREYARDALAVACQPEAEAVALTRELRTLLHQQIESLRGDANGLSALESTSQKEDAMVPPPDRSNVAL